MRRFAVIFLLSISALILGAQEKKVYQMGEVYGVDSSKCSSRSFPKRLVTPKGAAAIGIQGLWVKMDASDAQALALVSDVTGSVKVGRAAVAFMCAYANNNAIGLRLGYTHLDLFSESGTIRLFTDDLKFDLGKMSTKMNSFSAAVINRSWFGLDDRGRIALITDVALEYAHSVTGGETATATTDKAALQVAPGLEIFVMNNLSFFFTLNFANLSYSYSRCGEEGISSTFNAQIRLNVLDLNFGMALYF